MKLSKEIKNKIDTYFDNISAEELLNIAVLKYGFSNSDFEIENQSFNTVKKSLYFNASFSTSFSDDNFITLQVA